MHVDASASIFEDMITDDVFLLKEPLDYVALGTCSYQKEMINLNNHQDASILDEANHA